MPWHMAQKPFPFWRIFLSFQEHRSARSTAPGKALGLRIPQRRLSGSEGLHATFLHRHFRRTGLGA
jgi:hypothetical protein